MMNAIEELNLEMEASKAADARNAQLSSEFEAQVLAFVQETITREFDIDLNVRRFSKGWKQSDDHHCYELILNGQNEASAFSTIDIHFGFEGDGDIEITRFTVPSYGGNGNIDVRELWKFSSAVTKLTETLNGGLLMLKQLVEGFEDIQEKAKALLDTSHRSTYQIQNDIETTKQMLRVASLDICVGRKLMIEAHGARSTWSPRWVEGTITKVNKKTVQFVEVLSNGRNSDVSWVPFRMELFRTIEEHAEIEARKKAADEERRAKWNNR